MSTSPSSARRGRGRIVVAALIGALVTVGAMSETAAAGRLRVPVATQDPAPGATSPSDQPGVVMVASRSGIRW